MIDPGHLRNQFDHTLACVVRGQLTIEGACERLRVLSRLLAEDDPAHVLIAEMVGLLEGKKTRWQEEAK
jgi:hypothetical protein